MQTAAKLLNLKRASTIEHYSCVQDSCVAAAAYRGARRIAKSIRTGRQDAGIKDRASFRSLPESLGFTGQATLLETAGRPVRGAAARRSRGCLDRAATMAPAGNASSILREHSPRKTARRRTAKSSVPSRRRKSSSARATSQTAFKLPSLARRWSVNPSNDLCPVTMCAIYQVSSGRLGENCHPLVRLTIRASLQAP